MLMCGTEWTHGGKCRIWDQPLSDDYAHQSSNLHLAMKIMAMHARPTKAKAELGPAMFETDVTRCWYFDLAAQARVVLRPKETECNSLSACLLAGQKWCPCHVALRP